MAARTDPEISDALLAQYQAGLITMDQLAASLRVSTQRVLRQLRTKGVDTSMRTRKRRMFARRLEATEDLPPGSAYAAIADLYRQGYSLREIGRLLHFNPQAARSILGRQQVATRPPWYDFVFRDPHGNPLDPRPFAEKLRAARRARDWTKKRLASECGLSPSAIWKMERGVSGVRWTTLRKLTAALAVTPAELGITWRPYFDPHADDAVDMDTATIAAASPDGEPADPGPRRVRRVRRGPKRR